MSANGQVDPPMQRVLMLAAFFALYYLLMGR
jgi:hypothetical protein